MKSVLLSIQPKWCEMIASGEKTVEIRKTKPKIETPFKCYIYCTINGTTARERDRNIFTDLRGKVIGEFICDCILSHCEMANADIAEQQGCINREKLFEYSSGKELYGWHISDLVIYDKPKDFRDFSKPCIFGKEGECVGLQCIKAMFTKSGLFDYCGNTLSRPQQSWCYVEELRDDQ